MRSDLILTLVFGLLLAVLLVGGVWLFGVTVPHLADLGELPP